jgi:hypothetical protein
VILCTLAIAACGGSSASPADKCEELLDTTCDRVTGCFPDQGVTKDQCIQAVQSVAPCSTVKSVGSGFDSCIDQLRNDSCAVLFTIDSDTGEPDANTPTACEDVLIASTRGPGSEMMRSVRGAVSSMIPQ